MSSIFANVSWGIYALMPQGWVFMLAIILIEAVVLSRGLTGSWWSRKVAIGATVANTISGAAGLFLSLKISSLPIVLWMPWVSSDEVNLEKEFALLSVCYCAAFLLSVLIEGVVLALMLKSVSSRRKIWLWCLLANVTSYLLGSIALYSWSFGFWQ